LHHQCPSAAGADNRPVFFCSLNFRRTIAVRCIDNLRNRIAIVNVLYSKGLSTWNVRFRSSAHGQFVELAERAVAGDAGIQPDRIPSAQPWPIPRGRLRRFGSPDGAVEPAVALPVFARGHVAASVAAAVLPPGD
jgi:hypothetical protein